eukprot:gene1579-962_t
MDKDQIVNLLHALRSADNAERSAAEAQYEAMKAEQPVLMMHAIVEVCATSTEESTTTIGLILLRKVFNADPSPFDAADDSIRMAVKARMLEVLGSCVSKSQRGSAAGCVSALAVKVYQRKESWSELWESVFGIISSADAPCTMKTICCEIITTTAAAMTEYFQSHVDQIATSLHTCFMTTGEGSIDLKVATFNVVLKLSSLGMIKELAPLVPLMMGVIQECLNNEDWDSAERLTSCVAEGISTTPELFSSCTVPLLSGLMQRPKTVRKVPDFSTSFFELLFQYTLQPEYPDNWDVADLQGDEQELEEDLDQVIGWTGLDRLSIALGGRKLHTTAQNLFTQNIGSSDWRHRNGAVLLICYVAEGMSAVLKKMLPALVASIIPSISDEVKYVRANALDCISQLNTDFSPELEMQLHAQVLPPVIQALRDPIPHVAACAARCLDTFFDAIMGDDEEEETDEKLLAIFQPYVERVCVDCVALMQSTAHNFVREAALGALSSLTSTCKHLLAPYANDLVKVYQEVLAFPDSPEVMDIKCKAIECVTLLACGVGKEVFAPYTHDICNFLGSMSAGGLRTDDPRSRFVFRGWTCMVECLKEDVLPYMPQVMPALLFMMNADCDAVVEDADVGDDGEADPEDGYERCRIVIPGVGEKVAKFHTSMIEDKELASNIVNAMLQELGMSLQPFFQDIAQGAIKLLSFNLNCSVRENGALVLGAIMEACSSSGNKALSAELAMAAFPDLMTALEEESDADTMDTFIQVLSQCVDANPGVISLNAKTPGEVCEKLVGTLTNVLKQREECEAKIAEEEDEDELDQLHDENDELENSIRSLCELVGTLFERAGAVFTPVFIETLLPVVSTWLTPEKDDFLVGRGLVILCDFVENSPDLVASSLEHMVQLAIGFATTRTDPDLLQTAFFLISLLAQYIGQHHAATPSGIKFAQDAQAVLATYFAAPQATKDEKYAHCTTNALSAYVALAQSFPDALQAVLVPMLETITAHLPAKDDEIEAARIHDRVLQWIASNNPIVAAVPGCAAAMLQRIKSANPDHLTAAAKQQLATM